jgi:hypothetical protein
MITSIKTMYQKSLAAIGRKEELKFIMQSAHITMASWHVMSSVIYSAALKSVVCHHH